MTRERRQRRIESGPTIIRTSKVCAKCWNLKPVALPSAARQTEHCPLFKTPAQPADTSPSNPRNKDAAAASPEASGTWNTNHTD